ncbi:MAG: hypothetical protein JXA42_11045 [Anaerolineales bacterium]|nr:hypothetical protein [Anaerolineales bacterium]
MKVNKIIWIPVIEEKPITKHNVHIEEVEEVLFNRPHIRFVEKGHRDGENLYAAYG